MVFLRGKDNSFTGKINIVNKKVFLCFLLQFVSCNRTMWSHRKRSGNHYKFFIEISIIHTSYERDILLDKRSFYCYCYCFPNIFNFPKKIKRVVVGFSSVMFTHDFRMKHLLIIKLDKWCIYDASSRCIKLT